MLVESELSHHNDISGTWQAGSDTGGVITNRIVPQNLATMVKRASGDFTAGSITGNGANVTAEVVSWTSGTNI